MCQVLGENDLSSDRDRISKYLSKLFLVRVSHNRLMSVYLLCRCVRGCSRRWWRLRSPYGRGISTLCLHQWSSWMQSNAQFTFLMEAKAFILAAFLLLWADVCLCISAMMRWECFSLWWSVRTRWRAASFKSAGETPPSKRPCTSLRSRTFSPDTFLLPKTSEWTFCFRSTVWSFASSVLHPF